VCPLDPDDYAQPGCRFGGWIESKEVTEQKREYLDLINNDRSTEDIWPRKLSTDEKKYLSLCIALWQSPCMYSEVESQYTIDERINERNSWKKVGSVKTENWKCKEDSDDDKKPSPSSATLGSVIPKTDILESSEKKNHEKIPSSATVAFNPYLKRKRAPITGIAHKILKKEDK
jgi:hypothetical protein